MNFRGQIYRSQRAETSPLRDSAPAPGHLTLYESTERISGLLLFFIGPPGEPEAEAQSLTLPEFNALMESLEPIVAAVGNTFGRLPDEA